MSTSESNLTISSIFDVRDKIALVTGGGSGLGTMMASALVQNGAKVYIASRKEKQLQEARSTNKDLDRVIILLPTLSKSGCDALGDAFKQRESKLHILINNSGATWGAKWEETPEKEGWDRVMALNVKGLFFLTVALTEVLAKDSTAEDPAKVINISSVASYDTHAEETALGSEGHGLWSYNTSKAAVNHLTQLMAVTLSKKFITVNAILPGVFPSKMTAFGFKSAADALTSNQPMGRVGSPRDMAGLALFLASPASRHITGALIPIDGGALIHGRPLGDSRAKKAKL
ncbi:hypothetical protein FRB95_008237 [Tulasnella sp. JGI-2019a]|nr:hypothetical protein FRB95_008237 [Tulasnella sp. JGI-2019a]